MLLALVFVYLLITIAIGLLAAKKVHNSADFAIAGRNLPLAMIVTTTFATWFGSETVLGIPAKFVNGGLQGVVEDPFGAGFCLIFVGLFFAGKLYKMTLLTISDYYRERYGRVVEVLQKLTPFISVHLEKKRCLQLVALMRDLLAPKIGNSISDCVRWAELFISTHD